MNLITNILLAPVMLPSKGLMYIFEQVMEQAENEFNDPNQIRKALINLQQRVDAGKLTVERCDAAEAVLLRRLDDIEKRRLAAEQPRQRPIVASGVARGPRRRRRRPS